jgi:hypothetical protein
MEIEVDGVTTDSLTDISVIIGISTDRMEDIRTGTDRTEIKHQRERLSN